MKLEWMQIFLTAHLRVAWSRYSVCVFVCVCVCVCVCVLTDGSLPLPNQNPSFFWIQRMDLAVNFWPISSLLTRSVTLTFILAASDSLTGNFRVTFSADKSIDCLSVICHIHLISVDFFYYFLFLVSAGIQTLKKIFMLLFDNINLHKWQ